MVTARDRRHFEAIAEGERLLRRDSIEACAARSPGDNIELGFALTELAVSFGGDLSRPDEISPAALKAERIGRSNATS